MFWKQTPEIPILAPFLTQNTILGVIVSPFEWGNMPENKYINSNYSTMKDKSWCDEENPKGDITEIRGQGGHLRGSNVQAKPRRVRVDVSQCH